MENTLNIPNQKLLETNSKILSNMLSILPVNNSDDERWLKDTSRAIRQMKVWQILDNFGEYTKNNTRIFGNDIDKKIESDKIHKKKREAYFPNDSKLLKEVSDFIFDIGMYAGRFMSGYPGFFRSNGTLLINIVNNDERLKAFDEKSEAYEIRSDMNTFAIWEALGGISSPDFRDYQTLNEAFSKNLSYVSKIDIEEGLGYFRRNKTNMANPKFFANSDALEQETIYHIGHFIDNAYNHIMESSQLQEEYGGDLEELINPFKDFMNTWLTNYERPAVLARYELAQLNAFKDIDLSVENRIYFDDCF